jgi:hypothetical protein
MLYNSVDATMKLSTSEWEDTAGNPSDTEHLRDMSVGVPVNFSFVPGTVMGYSGRTASNNTRINRVWLVAPGVYAFHIENTNQPAAVADQIPDGVLLYDTTATVPAVELVYQAPSGREMRTPIVDKHRPELVLCGEKDRAGGTNQKVLLINVLKKKVTEVTDTTNTLPSAQFVR